MAPKKQAQKMSLGDFLGDKSLGSWADEMEDMPVSSDSRTGYGGDRRAFSSQGGFGGDRVFSGPSDRLGYAVREQLPLPTKPPFTAHLGNLSFDATEGDIHDFFSGCEVTNVRIVEDRLNMKPKGFGYVEFATVDGLKKALELNGVQFQGRNIRISVADPPKDRPDARELGDWTRKGPLPDLPGQNQRRASERSGGFKGYEAAPEMERSGSRRGGAGFDDGKVRNFDNWERKGPLSPAPAPSPPMRDGGRVREREGGGASWGEGRSQDGSRPPKGDFRERQHPERQLTQAELDTQWRSKMRPDPPAKSVTPTPDPSAPSSPAQPTASAVRPKLNLAKRTVSEADPAATATPSDSKASPFGAARPIDTATREREVEEKRQLAIRQKREAEEKVREEKKAKEAAAKAEKDKDKDKDKEKEKEKEKTAPAVQQNGKADDLPESSSDLPPSGKSYEILRRMTDENGDNDDDSVDIPANGNVVENKAVKPEKQAREPPTGPKAQQNWRRKPSNSKESPAQTPTGETHDEDGWSTVPTKSKNPRKGGQQGARPIAS